MICPACGFENLQGVDECENCGADLRTSDIPRPGNEFEARLVSEHLAVLDPSSPILVSPDTDAAAAVRTMQREEVDYVLVAEGGKLIGIFTERDALLKLTGSAYDGTPVSEVMTRDPVVLRESDSIAVAIHKMAVGGFRHIPLVDGGRPTGIVSSRDVFHHILEILG